MLAAYSRLLWFPCVLASASALSPPTMDIINRIALGTSGDAVHRIFFRGSDRPESLTLDELDRRAGAVAWHLSSLGVLPRDRVGVMMQNCIEWVLVDLALLKLGAVVAGFE